MKLIAILTTLIGITMNTAMADFQTDMTIGETLKANRYKNLYFAGQPSFDEFGKLKEQGFETVINLRMEFEHDEPREEALVLGNEMGYFNIPFNTEEGIIKEITETVKANMEKGKVLIHCKSGNRVGIWVGVYFFMEYNYTKAEAMDVAVEMGITKIAALNQLKNYLDKLEAERASLLASVF